MEGHDGHRRVQRHPETPREVRARHRSHHAEAIEAGRADLVHAPVFLAHAAHALGVRRGGDEVQVRELRERMAHLLVDGTLGHLAPVHVGDGDGERQRGHRGREHLQAIPEDHDDVRAAARQRRREALDAAPGRRRHRQGRVRLRDHGHALGDRPAVGLDGAPGEAEAGIEMGAAGDEQQLHVGRGAQLREQRCEVPVVGARDGDDRDSPWHRSILACGHNASAVRRAMLE